MDANSENNKHKTFRKVWQALYEQGDTEEPAVREAIERLFRTVQTAPLDERAVFDRIQNKARSGHNLRQLFRWAAKYAAVIILPLCCMLGGYWMWHRGADNGQTETFHTAANTAITLTLASGEQIQLDANNSGAFRSTDLVDIRQDSVKGLSYRSKGIGNTEIRYNVLSVPIAAEYRLKLSDGTVVYLNSDSRLKYPEVFADKERKVYLEGEGYFEVAKDAEHPFKVVAKDVEVNVLGTHFNVNAYSEHSNVVTTLVEGKVSVNNESVRKILQPGEQAIASNGGMEVKKVDVREYIGWKDGLFMFSSMTLSDIMVQVYRWYGIKARFADEELRTLTFTGIINKNVSAEKLFRVIEKVVKVRFESGGDKEVVISKK